MELTSNMLGAVFFVHHMSDGSTLAPIACGAGSAKSGGYECEVCTCECVCGVGVEGEWGASGCECVRVGVESERVEMEGEV